MTPPSHHVTLFSAVQIRLGELPEATGAVSLFAFADRRRKENAVYLGGILLSGKPLLMHAERLHVLLNRSTFELGEWNRLGIWSVELLPSQ